MTHHSIRTINYIHTIFVTNLTKESDSGYLGPRSVLRLYFHFFINSYYTFPSSVICSSFSRPQLTVKSPLSFWPSSGSSNSQKLQGTLAQGGREGTSRVNLNKPLYPAFSPHNFSTPRYAPLQRFKILNLEANGWRRED